MAIVSLFEALAYEMLSAEENFLNNPKDFHSPIISKIKPKIKIWFIFIHFCIFYLIYSSADIL